MKSGAKLYFVEYDHIFRFIPSQDWLEEDIKIKEKFDNCGFKVEVNREKTLFWEVLHIYGGKK